MKKYLLLLLLFPTCVSAQWQIPTSGTTVSIPFVAIDSTDHVTALTTITSITCRRIKNGSDSACANSPVTSAGGGEVSDANHPGTWKYTLGSSDTDTAGSLVLYFTSAGMDPVRVPIQVGGAAILPASVVASVTGAVGSVTANPTCGDISTAALAKFFSVNTTQTVSTAIDGSVVKEITKNRPSSH